LSKFVAELWRRKLNFLRPIKGLVPRPSLEGEKIKFYTPPSGQILPRLRM
jgi:hypothetical protein